MKDVRSNNTRRIIIIASIVPAIILVAVILAASRVMTFPFISRQSEIEYRIAHRVSDSPFGIKYDHSTLTKISAEIVDVSPKAALMADPFVIKHNDEYYIFYEILQDRFGSTGGDIAVLHSKDGEDWSDLGIVLNERFHLSYPNVFYIDGVWYMIPEAYKSKECRIYTTDNFPYDWRLHKVAVKRPLVDVSVINHNDTFYIFAHENNTSLLLFYSDKIDGEWIEHPLSPIREGHNNNTRPGGNPFYFDNQLYYLTQNHRDGYGTGLWCHKIDTLSRSEFSDSRLPTPLLWKNGDSWAGNGMHHLTFVEKEGGELLIVVDGSEDKETRWEWNWSSLPEFNF